MQPCLSDASRDISYSRRSNQKGSETLSPQITFKTHLFITAGILSACFMSILFLLPLA